jgi:hypothetical protein
MAFAYRGKLEEARRGIGKITYFQSISKEMRFSGESHFACR